MQKKNLEVPIFCAAPHSSLLPFLDVRKDAASFRGEVKARQLRVTTFTGGEVCRNEKKFKMKQQPTTEGGGLRLALEAARKEEEDGRVKY